MISFTELVGSRPSIPFGIVSLATIGILIMIADPSAPGLTTDTGLTFLGATVIIFGIMMVSVIYLERFLKG